MNPYRQLNAPELVVLWAKIVQGYTNKGRDAHALRSLMDEKDVVPPQVVLGFCTWTALNGPRDVPSFVKGLRRWLVEDPLEAEAELCIALGLQNVRPYLLLYLDARDAGVPDARIEAAYARAKTELEAKLGPTLDGSPTPKHRRAWATVQHNP